MPASLNRKKMSGKPPALSASLQIFIEAIADSGVFGDGFQMVMSPQIAAMKLFQAHTATGKLNAEMTPTMPSGCHCSYMRWPGRSECMVRPYSWRDRPTANSPMSIISCTSPSPSGLDLPISSATSEPSASLWVRSASAHRRIASPRRGAGVVRQTLKAASARSTMVS